jgi:hypothetical protein
MPCTVCNHPQLPDIELALLAGDTLKSLHQRYGPSPSALQRHKKHLESKMRSARYRLDNRLDQGSLLRLNNYLDHLDRVIAQAEADGESDRVIRGCLAGSRIMQQMQRLQVEWDLDSVYRLTHAAAPASLDSLLPAGPGALAELNRAFLHKASSPCPEPEGEEGEAARDAQAAAKPEDSCETQISRLEALNMLQNLLPDLELSLTAAPELPDSQTAKALPPKNTACCSPPAASCLSPGVNLSFDDILIPAGNEAADDRKISGKSPANTTPQTNKIEEIQEDKPGENNLPKNSGLGRDQQGGSDSPGAAPPAFRALPDSAPGSQQRGPKRDASGTDAGQISSRYENIEENKRDVIEEQISGTNMNAYPLPAACCPPPVASCPPETLDDVQAAELAEYLANFSPYAEPAPDPNSEIASATPLSPSGVRLDSSGTCKPGPKPPPPYDETARRADELFMMSHGYPRNNPPKRIPNRRRDEDFRSNLVFGDPSKIYG